MSCVTSKTVINSFLNVLQFLLFAWLFPTTCHGLICHTHIKYIIWQQYEASPVWMFCIWIHQKTLLFYGAIHCISEHFLLFLCMTLSIYIPRFEPSLFCKIAVFLNILFSFPFFALLFLSTCHGWRCHNGEYGRKDDVTTRKKQKQNMILFFKKIFAFLNMFFCFFLCMTLVN